MKYSKLGYKRYSPDLYKRYNIIPSGRITMKDVDFPVFGIDNLGNQQMMYPGREYQFPGNQVFELPMYQTDGEVIRLPSVDVYADARQKEPYWHELTAEQKRYWNNKGPIGRGVRRRARVGDKSLYSDLEDIARQVQYTGAELTGLPGAIRFSEDPIGNLKGAGHVVENFMLGTNPMASSFLNTESTPEESQQFWNTVDAAGLVTAAGPKLAKTTVGVGKYALRPLEKPLGAVNRTVISGLAKSPYVPRFTKPSLLESYRSKFPNIDLRGAGTGDYSNLGVNELGLGVDDFRSLTDYERSAISQLNQTQATDDIFNTFVQRYADFNTDDVLANQLADFSRRNPRTKFEMNLGKGVTPSKRMQEIFDDPELNIHNVFSEESVGPMNFKNKWGYDDSRFYDGSAHNYTGEFDKNLRDYGQVGFYAKNVPTGKPVRQSLTHTSEEGNVFDYVIETVPSANYVVNKGRMNPDNIINLSRFRGRGDMANQHNFLLNNTNSPSVIISGNKGFAGLQGGNRIRERIGRIDVPEPGRNVPLYNERVAPLLKQEFELSKPFDGTFIKLPYNLKTYYNSIGEASPHNSKETLEYNPFFTKTYQPGGEHSDILNQPSVLEKYVLSPGWEGIKAGAGWLGDRIGDVVSYTGEQLVTNPITMPYVTQASAATSNFLADGIRPVEYPDPLTAAGLLLRAAVGANEPPIRDAEGDYAMSEEAWRRALGLKVDPKYLPPSQYKPTKATNPNAQYYGISRSVIDPDLLVQEALSRGIQPGQNIVLPSLAPYIRESYMNRDEFSQIDPLQNFTISSGSDDKGKYISIYDKYDFSQPYNSFINPFEIYDRFYYEPGGELQEYGKGGLTQWFAEKWVDVKTGKECGRSGKDKNGRPYPACRPSKRVNETTPKTTSEMSSSEKAKFKREKRSGKRINYNHKRAQEGIQVPPMPNLYQMAQSPQDRIAIQTPTYARPNQPKPPTLSEYSDYLQSQQLMQEAKPDLEGFDWFWDKVTNPVNTFSYMFSEKDMPNRVEGQWATGYPSAYAIPISVINPFEYVDSGISLAENVSEGNWAEAGWDALGVAPGLRGVKPVARAARSAPRVIKTGVNNLYKLNPKAVKTPPFTTVARIQQSGQTGDLLMSRYYDDLLDSGRQLTPSQRIKALRRSSDSRPFGYGQGFSMDPGDMSYYVQARGLTPQTAEVLSYRMPTSQLNKFRVSNLSDDARRAYGSGKPTREFLLPIEDILKADKVPMDQVGSLQRAMGIEQTPHWWRGYPNNLQKGGRIPRYQTEGEVVPEPYQFKYHTFGPDAEPVFMDSGNVESAELLDLRERIVDRALNIIDNSDFYYLPKDIAAITPYPEYNTCISGVCRVYKDMGVMDNIIYGNTEFAEKYKNFGFTRGQNVDQMAPGDMIQHFDHTNDQGSFYPTHAQLYLGKTDDGDYLFFDNYDGTSTKSGERGYRIYSRGRIDDWMNKTPREGGAAIYYLNSDSDKKHRTDEEQKAYDNAQKGRSRRLPLEYEYDMLYSGDDYTNAIQETRDLPYQYYSTSPSYLEAVEKSNNPVIQAVNGQQGVYGAAMQEQNLLKLFSNQEMDQKLVNMFGLTDQSLNELKKYVYGIIKQESNFGEPNSTLRGFKYRNERYLPGNPSLGLAQVRYKDLRPFVKEELKGKDALYTAEGAYIAALDMLLQSGRHADPYISEDHNSELFNSDPWAGALYWYNGQGRSLVRGNSSDGTPLRMDQGSYPQKVLEQASTLKRFVPFDADLSNPDIYRDPWEAVVSPRIQKYGGKVPRYRLNLYR